MQEELLKALVQVLEKLEKRIDLLDQRLSSLEGKEGKEPVPSALESVPKKELSAAETLFVLLKSGTWPKEKTLREHLGID